MDEASATDVSLLARMAQRDPQALDLFYTRHARAVFSLALTMLGDHARATDLAQEVFLLVWRSAGAYQPTGSARAWLLRLTRNRAIDELRRDRRRRASEAPLSAPLVQALPVPLADAAERQADGDSRSPDLGGAAAAAAVCGGGDAGAAGGEGGGPGGGRRS